MSFFQYGNMVEREMVTVTAGGTTTLVNTSPVIQIFTGSSGQTIVLPDATTFSTSGNYYKISNQSSVALTLQFHGGTSFTDASGTSYSSIPPFSSIAITLQTNGTTLGTWSVISVSGSITIGSTTIPPGGSSTSVSTLTLTGTTTSSAITSSGLITANGGVVIGGGSFTGTPNFFSNGTFGLSMTIGSGSTDDFRLLTEGAGTILSIPHSTITPVFAGAVGIGAAPVTGMALDITSITTLALGLPLVPTASRPTGTAGMLIYNSTTNQLQYSVGGNVWDTVPASASSFLAPTVSVASGPGTAVGTGGFSIAGTYTRPTPAPLYIKVKMVGGGGGGGGSGTAGGTDGNVATAATATTFGTSLLSASFGAGGSGVGGSGGAGGTASLAGTPGMSVIGGRGDPGSSNEGVNFVSGGSGAGSFLGGSGGGGPSNGVGNAGSANTGGGGGGGGMTATPGTSGSGGGSGGYIEAIIASPAATYTFSVGAGGSGGAAGTSGTAGGAGGSGIIVVEEYYQ